MKTRGGEDDGGGARSEGARAIIKISALPASQGE